MENGKLIVLTRELQREQLKEWRKTTSYFCPQCNVPVYLKVGDITIPHFAHQKDVSCASFFSEGETKEHLQGKQQLFAFLSEHVEKVELEPFIKMLSQRPDLLVTNGSNSIPIEFQCSTVPVSLIKSRSAGYWSIGMNPIWILHTPAKFKTLPEGVGIFHFSKFHESFFIHTIPEGHVFLTYNPLTERFHYFSSLIHVAGKRYIGIHRSLSSSQQRFPFARPKIPTEVELNQYVTFYLSIRHDFLKSRILLNRRGVNDPFLRMCYELHVRPTELPIWIGLPVPFGDAFVEHDCEWQLALIRYMRLKGIRFRELSDGHVHKFVSGLDGPSDEKKKACMTYRDFLISTGVESFQMDTIIDENYILNLFSVRFLAKSYGN
ncbi:competence protein CoiA [Filibacter limicola]|uniref:Competence protein CoiA n=2 Tax=Sporosarcina limicola TaxID=34101 RepID=A0A927MQK9_9BACL|nr:competence protein CoiA family protein [Sporosarcina limicola]MBE1557157.1 competence protein CoiA [Sporosarcina limicola]